jgi:cysteine desulfurase/selenocysteine lyase
MIIDSNYRKDFPIIDKSDMAYLDSAATSQKPTCVLNALKRYYTRYNANPNRGTYTLSELATQKYAKCRSAVAKFIHAKKSEEIVFTKNATEAINLVAYSYVLNNLKQDDEIVLSIMEHHSAIVPMQQIASKVGAKLRYIYLNKDFELSHSDIDSTITDKTKFVVISHVSNVLGTINDVKYITKVAHSHGAVVLVDASQSIAHCPVDVRDLDADFLVFSGHKMYAPMGIGVLYGKHKLLKNMSPFLTGGDMIEYVYEDHTTFADLPNKFEAGTQNVEGAMGLKCAIDYINKIGYDNISKHESKLYNYMLNSLKALPYITIYAGKHACGVVSFNVKGIHAHDVASILSSKGVCVRAGNHCAQPLLRHIGVDSTLRCSIAMYNNSDDVDNLVGALEHVHKIFAKYIKE